MIYNLSTILREIYNKTDTSISIPNSFEKNNNVKPHYNLKINTELANQKSLELYKKYNTNTYRKVRVIDFGPIIKCNLEISDTDKTFAFYIKNGLVIGCFFILLACFPHYSYSYTYFKK
jgi:hypothetical protein